jgi:hypothetical protein
MGSTSFRQGSLDILKYNPSVRAGAIFSAEMVTGGSPASPGVIRPVNACGLIIRAEVGFVKDKCIELSLLPRGMVHLSDVALCDHKFPTKEIGTQQQSGPMMAQESSEPRDPAYCPECCLFSCRREAEGQGLPMPEVDYPKPDCEGTDHPYLPSGEKETLCTEPLKWNWCSTDLQTRLTSSAAPPERGQSVTHSPQDPDTDMAHSPYVHS